jgi:ATP-dependent helicase HrpA
MTSRISYGCQRFTDPEILRSPSASVILYEGVALGGDWKTFAFIEPLQAAPWPDGYQLLAELGAVDDDNEPTAGGSHAGRCHWTRVLAA